MAKQGKARTNDGNKPVGERTVDEARRELARLRRAIEHHDHLYYVENRPEISDAAYDRLFDRLVALEDAFPELRTSDSPSQRVGAPPSDRLARRRHAAPMLSLHASLEFDDIARFVERLAQEAGGTPELVLEPKFDGLSVELVYDAGELRYAATRGDGETGEDISENVRAAGIVPERLEGEALPARLAVRGEIFMPKDGFRALNRERLGRGEEPFANPRNAAAGLIRQLDSREVAGKPLAIVCYELLAAQGYAPESHWQLLGQLAEWGLAVTEERERSRSLAAVRRYHERLGGRREGLNYEIDGIVVKLDKLALRQRLGTRQRSPRWAMAWKFPPKKEVTRVEEIVVQVGRTGMLTPVALLDPVDVGGVTVSRATLHNEEEVRRKDIRPGDRVRIERAGDVIPEVTGRVETPGRKRGEPFEMPGQCPSCGTEVERQGAFVLCPAGLACRAQLIGRLVHYASRRAMDIDGLGRQTAAALVERRMVGDIADLYDLATKDLLELPFFAEKSAAKLHRAIQGAKRVGLNRFLYALGIREVGEHLATVLAHRFGSLDAMRKASEAELEAVAEVGPKTAAHIRRFFADRSNRRVLDRLLAAGVEPVAVERQRGGRATSSVSGNTDLVVAGRDPGSKLAEARRRHIRVIGEEEFKTMLVSGAAPRETS